MDDLTPVERHGDLWLKRDDLYERAGIRGGKVRICWHLAQGAPALTAASARKSPQQQIVARIAAALGIPCRIHTASGPPTAEQQDAAAHGAELEFHRPGYNGVLVARARAYAAVSGAREIPFGMLHPDAVGITRPQTANVPDDARRIVMAVGVGMAAAGILWGLRDRGLEIPVVGVSVGARPEKHMDRYAPPDWRRQMRIVQSHYDYATEVHESVGGVSLDPIYEAKCVELLKPGDLFWIIGCRPKPK